MRRSSGASCSCTWRPSHEALAIDIECPGPADPRFHAGELIIAVAVVGILAAVALPSYQAHIASRRSDARSALLGSRRCWSCHTEQGTYVGATLGSATLSLDLATRLLHAVHRQPGCDQLQSDRHLTGAQIGDKCGDYTYDQADTKGVASASTGYTAAKCW